MFILTFYSKPFLLRSILLLVLLIQFLIKYSLLKICTPTYSCAHRTRHYLSKYLRFSHFRGRAIRNHVMKLKISYIACRIHCRSIGKILSRIQINHTPSYTVPRGTLVHFSFTSLHLILYTYCFHSIDEKFRSIAYEFLR